MNTKFTGMLKVSIYMIGLITLSLFIWWLPWVAKEAAAMNPEFAYLRYPVLFGLYANGIPFYLALFQVLKLLKCIEMNTLSVARKCSCVNV